MFFSHKGLDLSALVLFYDKTSCSTLTNQIRTLVIERDVTQAKLPLIPDGTPEDTAVNPPTISKALFISPADLKKVVAGETKPVTVWKILRPALL
ncbi:hypothetical protein IAR50_004384 [Cryptococcus sp. DSM 104548]